MSSRIRAKDTTDARASEKGRMLSDSVLPAHRMRASTALSELAAKGVLSDLLPLLSRDRRLLHQRLKMLGFSALGDRIAIEHALCQVGRAPPLGAPPLPPRGKEATGPWIVATHAREDVHWMPLLLATHSQLRIVLYECGLEPLPASVREHPRVEVREKSGSLAPVPFFYSVFDFCARNYDVLPEYMLFMRMHTHTHMHMPANSIHTYTCTHAYEHPCACITGEHACKGIFFSSMGMNRAGTKSYLSHDCSPSVALRSPLILRSSFST